MTVSPTPEDIVPVGGPHLDGRRSQQSLWLTGRNSELSIATGSVVRSIPGPWDWAELNRGFAWRLLSFC